MQTVTHSIGSLPEDLHDWPRSRRSRALDAFEPNVYLCDGVGKCGGQPGGFGSLGETRPPVGMRGKPRPPETR